MGRRYSSIQLPSTWFAPAHSFGPLYVVWRCFQPRKYNIAFIFRIITNKLLLIIIILLELCVLGAVVYWKFFHKKWKTILIWPVPLHLKYSRYQVLPRPYTDFVRVSPREIGWNSVRLRWNVDVHDIQDRWNLCRHFARPYCSRDKHMVIIFYKINYDIRWN